MGKFVFTYRAPSDYTPFQPETVGEWMAWFEGLGSQLVDAGQPVREARQIGDCGPDQRLGGFSIVSADDLDGALELAQGCPGLAAGFGVEVGALTDPSQNAA